MATTVETSGSANTEKGADETAEISETFTFERILWLPYDS